MLLHPNADICNNLIRVPQALGNLLKETSRKDIELLRNPCSAMYDSEKKALPLISFQILSEMLTSKKHSLTFTSTSFPFSCSPALSSLPWRLIFLPMPVV